jgi:ElaB/YqjD/DUF883 family membrane-anchored ribosome-binding protein
MAQTYEGRHQRRNGNGDLRSHANHVREDVATLQKDLSQLRSDLGGLIAMQWRAAGEQMNSGVNYMSEQVRTRPVASIGVAATAGLLAGLALASMNGRSHARR